MKPLRVTIEWLLSCMFPPRLNDKQWNPSHWTTSWEYHKRLNRRGVERRMTDQPVVHTAAHIKGVHTVESAAEHWNEHIAACDTCTSVMSRSYLCVVGKELLRRLESLRMPPRSQR